MKTAFAWLAFALLALGACLYDNPDPADAYVDPSAHAHRLDSGIAVDASAGP